MRHGGGGAAGRLDDNVSGVQIQFMIFHNLNVLNFTAISSASSFV